MKWALLELAKYKDNPLQFEAVVDISSNLKKRDTAVIAVEPVKVTGQLRVTGSEYVADFTIETVMTLPSTRSLTPVALPQNIHVTEIYMTPLQFQARQEFLQDDDELIMVLEKDQINLVEAVEDHLLLAIPLQVLTPEEELGQNSLKGEAWELMSEAAYHQRQEQQEEKNIDPRLAKLAALLDNDKDSTEE